MPTIPRKDCPYQWWKQHHIQKEGNSSLCEIAKAYLCTPPSSVSSERLFSTAGNVYESKRNRLSPEHGEQIALLHCNMKIMKY